MKVKVFEFDGCFSFDLFPESVEDAVILVRVKLNGIKEVRGIHVDCTKNLMMYGSVVIGKRKEVKTSL